jgi:spoIIIJ-associated protein
MSDLTVEAIGETVGEAKWAAVRELQRLSPGIDRNAIEFQVLSEGERGLLGVGTTPARVMATVPAPASTPGSADTAADAAAPTLPLPENDVEVATGVVELALAALDVPARVTVTERDDEVVATASGDDVGVLIGRHGQMLEALQVLANAVAHARLGDDRRRIVIDAAGYRERRRETLEELARHTAERVSATQQATSLEPMSASERRIVHEALKDDPEVSTASDGVEPYRCVVVHPRVGSV